MCERDEHAVDRVGIFLHNTVSNVAELRRTTPTALYREHAVLGCARPEADQLMDAGWQIDLC